MTPALDISSLETSDIDAAVDLWRRCELLVPWNDPKQDIDFALSQPNADVLIGKCHGDLVASVMVGHDGHRGSVYYLAVDPDYRKRGYGRVMMDMARHWLQERGVWKLNIMVRAGNKQVIGFYERLGAALEDRAVLSLRLSP